MQRESATRREPHVPIRTCVGCRTRRPRVDLVRCVLDAGGVVRIDTHEPGRGAWLCGPECFVEAAQRGGFERAFRGPVDRSQFDEARRTWAARADQGRR